MSDRLIARLTEVVGDAHVLVDADVRASYEIDWTRLYRGEARCVVRPGSTAEVAAIVAACAEFGVPIVPQGGNTGLVGGGVPRGGEVLLSLTRLNATDPVDAGALQVTVGAGVTISNVHAHARATGLDFAVDWGARDSATVGGAIATNAGGSRVVRFGTMRAQVMGIEAVFADGTIVSDLAGLPKQTAGMHLPSMLVGSEGTLAVVTSARLRLVPWFRSTAAALVACDSLVHAVALLPTLRALTSLDAVELLMPEALTIACDHLGIAPPIDPVSAGAFVLVDCAAHHDPTHELAALLAQTKGVLATDSRRDTLFRIRDHVTIAIAARGRPLKLDVAVPVHQLDRLARRTRSAVQSHAPAAEVIVFGHLAEGNLHVNVLGAGEAATAIRADVLGAAVELGGTVSAEHGIGVAKTDWLRRTRGDATTDVMTTIKHALDPQGILNPGVLLA